MCHVIRIRRQPQLVIELLHAKDINDELQQAEAYQHVFSRIFSLILPRGVINPIKKIRIGIHLFVSDDESHRTQSLHPALVYLLVEGLR